MTDLNALLDRVRSATGPDRDLDAAVMALSYTQDERHIGAVMEYSDGSEERVKDLVWVDPKTDKWVSTSAHSFTASIDAALALTERVLPGWGVYFRRDKETTGAGMLLPDHFRVTPAHEEAATLPLAILAATLSALIAKETQ